MLVEPKRAPRKSPKRRAFDGAVRYLSPKSRHMILMYLYAFMTAHAVSSQQDRQVRQSRRQRLD
jgi:hypothetical protein